jgi:phosphatidylserine decarboxylase
MGTLFIYLQKVLPSRLLARLAYRLARSRARWVKNLLIGAFVRLYPVDLMEMDKSTPFEYVSLNAFFTRSLKADARPISAEPSVVCCPADGIVQQAGTVQDGKLIQAKGMSYRLVDLLGADTAAEFDGGAFLTIYLAPHNYHRVHAPLGGAIRRVHFIPGKRYAVNKTTARHLPGLFAMNERLACYCAGELSPYWLVFVGAMNVSSISTAWSGEIEPFDEPRQWTYSRTGAMTLNKGDYFGHFNMGSTVIVVFPRNVVSLSDALQPGVILRMGQEVGRL